MFQSCFLPVQALDAPRMRRHANINQAGDSLMMQCTCVYVACCGNLPAALMKSLGMDDTLHMFPLYPSLHLHLQPQPSRNQIIWACSDAAPPGLLKQQRTETNGAESLQSSSCLSKNFIHMSTAGSRLSVKRLLMS